MADQIEQIIIGKLRYYYFAAIYTASDLATRKGGMNSGANSGALGIHSSNKDLQPSKHEL